MTLLHYDNCGDTYAVGDIGYRGWSGGGSSLAVAAGRVSGSSLSLEGTTGITPDILTKTVALGSEFTWHMGVMTEDGNGSDLVLVEWDEGSTNHLQLVLTATNRFLRIKRNGTTVVTGTHALSLDSWHQVVAHIKIGDAATGQVHVWLDEVADITDTTSDFRNGATGVIDNFSIRAAFGNRVRFDDIHIWSGNDDHGNSRVLGRVAMAEGNYTDWTPLSGIDNAAMVDDATPDGDTTYVYSDTTAQRDSYEMQPLGIPSTATIHAYGITAIARKLDIGSRVVALFARTGGTDFDGSDQNPGFDYDGLQEFWELNPDTAAPWTVAEVDATEAGILDNT